MREPEHDKWVGTTYGNGWMHRQLIRMLRFIPSSAIYAFAAVFVVPPTMLVNAGYRKAIYRYFRNALKASPLKAAWLTYRNHCLFSQVVIDRFAAYAGKRFKLDLDGYDSFLRLAESDEGFVQLSSHIGNYEMAGYSLRVHNKRLNALVFANEKESVMKNRQKLFDANNIRMIPVQADMSHLFAIDAAISGGEIVSMPADRIFGSQKSFSCDFFGKPANFPQGPFVVAAARNVKMLFVAVMKTRRDTYHVKIRTLESPEHGTVRQKARVLADEYCRLLEETVREYPTQWYNFFDFWEK